MFYLICIIVIILVIVYLLPISINETLQISIFFRKTYTFVLFIILLFFYPIAIQCQLFHFMTISVHIPTVNTFLDDAFNRNAINYTSITLQLFLVFLIVTITIIKQLSMNYNPIHLQLESIILTHLTTDKSISNKQTTKPKPMSTYPQITFICWTQHFYILATNLLEVEIVDLQTSFLQLTKFLQYFSILIILIDVNVELTFITISFDVNLFQLHSLILFQLFVNNPILFDILSIMIVRSGWIMNYLLIILIIIISVTDNSISSEMVYLQPIILVVHTHQSTLLLLCHLPNTFFIQL